MRYAPFILCLLVFQAVADDVVLTADRGQRRIRLTQAGCTNTNILKTVPPQFVPLFKAAWLLVEGRTISACWIANEKGIYIRTEDSKLKLPFEAPWEREQGI